MTAGTDEMFPIEQTLPRATCTLARMIEMCASLGRSTRFATAFSLAAVLLTASTTSAQVPLGSAQTFAVLGGVAVTCTASAVTGNVGVAPGGAIVGCTPTPPGMVDPAASMAYANFLTAYSALQARPCVGAPLTGNLAGLTLPPGVYCVTAASTTTNGTLTLNGPATGVWIFKIGTGGGGALTGTGFSVVMAGGGQPCNVFWWVKDAATLTTSMMKGTILAGADITSTGSLLNGAALAGGGGSPFLPTGAVTLTGSAVSVCNMGGTFPPVGDKCEPPHHDRDHDHDGHHDKDDDHDKDDHGRDDHHDKDNDHKDRDHDSYDRKR